MARIDPPTQNPTMPRRLGVHPLHVRQSVEGLDHVARLFGGDPLVHHRPGPWEQGDESQAGQRRAQVDHPGVILGHRDNPQEHQHSGPLPAAGGTVQVARTLPQGEGVSHLFPHRRSGEPLKGLSRQRQHLGDEQQGLDEGAGTPGPWKDKKRDQQGKESQEPYAQYPRAYLGTNSQPWPSGGRIFSWY